MSPSPKEPEIGLEQMLRDWGAQEAVQSAQAPAAPDTTAVSDAEETALLPETPIATAPGRKSRWAPWSIAAAALIVTGIYAVHTHSKLSDLDNRLFETTGQLADARANLKQYDQQIASLQERLDTLSREGETSASALAAKKTELKSLTTELTRTKQALQATQATVSGARKQATQTQTEAAALLSENQRRMEAIVQDLDRRTGGLAAQKAELDRKLAQAQQWIDRGRWADDQAKALQVRNANLFESAQQAFLTARAGETSGLLARQLASRRSTLIARASVVRAAAGNNETRRLIEQLEVVLTRLDMIDPTQSDATGAFAQLLASTKVIERLNEALAGEIGNSAVRTWLFEVKMVLA